MPKNKFRISYRYKEIFSVINSEKSAKDNIIWKMVGSSRQTFPISISKVNGEQNRIDVKLKEYTPLLEIGNQVYLKLGAKESAFKTEILDRIGSALVLAFPEEMALHEYRASKRHYFYLSEEKKVQLQIGAQPYTLNTCDVSGSGICVFIPSDLESKVQVKSAIILDSLGDQPLESPIQGEVVFKMAFESGYKVGIQLRTLLRPKQLEIFLVKKNLFSITDETVVLDSEFRKKVHSKARVLRKRLSDKKKFKGFFDSLEIERADHQYLKQHIQLLCEVMCGLGVKLGWVTENTIDKLVYVAFLHDIRFGSLPHLARIETAKDYISIRESLSEVERKAYEEAPDFAVEVAKNDTDEFPDAVKILAAQREFSDAKSPLNCLFILSHVFVDYVLAFPDWSTDDFIKSNRNRLRGSYFKKIFEAMKK